MDISTTFNFANQKNISEIIKLRKTMSVEINPNDAIDFDFLTKMPIDFVSVSWIGNFEGFSTETIPAIKSAKELIARKITVLLHISCRNLDKVSALNILKYIREIGIQNIFAIEGESRFVTKTDISDMDFPYTCNFVEFIRENFENDFTIGVTGYPQKHPRSSDMTQELEYLKMKVSKGADFILTQGCLDKKLLCDFQKMCEQFLIFVPILAGTFLLRSKDQLKILRTCNIRIENELFQFRDEILQNNQSFESFFRRRLQEMGDMVLDNKNSNFAGLHIFSFSDKKFISEIEDEMSYFTKYFNSV